MAVGVILFPCRSLIWFGKKSDELLYSLFLGRIAAMLITFVSPSEICWTDRDSIVNWFRWAQGSRIIATGCIQHIPVYTAHLWLVGKHVVDFLLVLIELFCQLLRLRRYKQILWEIVVFVRGVSQFERKFQAEGRVVHQRLLASEN